MKCFRFPVRIILILGLLGFALPFAAVQSSDLKQGSFEALTLEISSPKEHFRLLEPIPLTLRVANRTEHVINAHSLLDFGHNYVELYVGRGQGQLRNIGRLSMASKLSLPKQRGLKPGEQFSIQQLLTLELDRIFPEPGSYRVTASVFDVDRKKSIMSKPMTIQIMPATGVDFQALEFIRTYGNPSSFFVGVNMDRDIHMLETFASAFGETAYGDYATFNIAQYRFGMRDYEKARQHFEKLARKRDFAFSEMASEYVDKIKKLKEVER